MCCGHERCPQYRAGPEHHPSGDRPDAGSERCRGYRRYTCALAPIPVCWIKLPRHTSCTDRKPIHERHRHRYEVNNDYRNALSEHGMTSFRTFPGRTYRGDDRAAGSSVLPGNPGSSGAEIQTQQTSSSVQRIYQCGAFLQTGKTAVNKKLSGPGPSARRSESFLFLFF